MIKELIAASTVILAVAGSYYGTYHYGKSVGAERVQNQWDAAKEKQKIEMGKLQAKYAELSKTHSELSGSYSQALQEQKNVYETQLADSQRFAAERLRLSNTRAGVYQRQAEGGEVERRNLASHAARLDQSLEEGIQVVGELQSLVGLRDRQLIILGQQIRTDRTLLEETTTND